LKVQLLRFIMSSFPFITLFSSTLFLSTFIALSASHWLIIWIALEINIISFLPIISISSWAQESEASIKYFFFQALGSRLFLLGSTNQSLFIFILLGLLIKLGVAPFHFWLPQVINAISWPICIILLTWQKIIPLLIITFSPTLSSSSLILLLARIRTIVGGLGGLNQTQIRPLLAYSSIGHLGWILAASSCSPSISITYFSIYSLISISLFYLLFIINKKELVTLNSIYPIKPSIILIFIILLLSLGGLPPLVGFFPKWIVLYSINSIPTTFFLISGSLLNLFYYLNIRFSLALTLPSFQTFIQPSSYSTFLSPFLVLSLITLPLLLLYAMTIFN